MIIIFLGSFNLIMSSITTKKAISYSLKELLLDKPLNKITINDICKKSSINRQTFYYHFEDIRDLVEYTTIEDANDALKNKDTYETWQEGFLSIFLLMKKDKVFINNIYHSISLDILQSYLYKLVYPIIYKVVDEKSSNKKVNEEDKKFITNFYMYSFVSLVLEWIKNDMKEDPNIIIKKVSSLLTGTIDSCIDNLKK